MSYPEKSVITQTQKGIRDIAPRHYESSVKGQYSSTLKSPLLPMEVTKKYINNDNLLSIGDNKMTNTNNDNKISEVKQMTLEEMIGRKQELYYKGDKKTDDERAEFFRLGHEIDDFILKSPVAVPTKNEKKRNKYKKDYSRTGKSFSGHGEIGTNTNVNDHSKYNEEDMSFQGED